VPILLDFGSEKENNPLVASKSKGNIMTELEEARAHLEACQAHLAWTRQAPQVFGANPDDAYKEFIRIDERRVLAALSWVWDVQERAGINLVADAYFASLRDSGYDPTSLLFSTAVGVIDSLTGNLIQ
jgi:hypothetical protein